jgi:diguanylate cyclase (GGDEF)-like protein
MENTLLALHFFLAFIVSLLMIKTLWPYRFFPGARVFFALIGVSGGLCLISGLEMVFPALAGYRGLIQARQWGQLALPLAAGLLILERSGIAHLRARPDLTWTGLLPVLFIILPASVMLLPVDASSVVIGGWVFCLIFSSYHLARSLQAGPLLVKPRRVILWASASLPVFTGLLHVLTPLDAAAITPLAVILFALVAGGIFQDEHFALARIANTGGPVSAVSPLAAWFILDRAGRTVDLDAFSLRQSGHEPEQVIGQPVKIFFPQIASVLKKMEDSQTSVITANSDIFEPAGTCQFSLHLPPHGDVIFHLRLIQVRPVDRALLPPVVETVSDASYNSLKKEAALLEIALDATLHGVLITDHSGNILFRNRHLLRLLDLPDRALRSEDKNWQEAFSRRVRDRQRFLNLMDQILVQKTSETLDIFELSNGRLVECQTRFTYAEALKDSFRLWCLTDCTEQQRREQELHHLSMHDTLTGMYNRAFFDARFNHFRANELYPVSMIMIDVDGLKRVNDDLGHPAGDDLLRQAAQVLRQACRTEDVVARLGGDEFAILLPRADANVAEQVMTRIHGLLNLYHIRHPQSAISLSLGYAVARSAREMEDLAIRADETMYENRRQRRIVRK